MRRIAAESPGAFNMSEMLLLGAGASKEAGVPTAFGLTNAIANEFRANRGLRRHAQVVSFVLGGLLFNKGIHGEDPLNSGVNVEEFFNAIQLLADRNTLEAAPFVGSWHAMVEEFDKLTPTPHADRLHEVIFRSVTEKIFSSLPSSLPSFAAGDLDRKLERTITKTIEAAVRRQSTNISLSDSVGRELGDFVMKIMKEWIDRLKRERPRSFEFEQEFRRAIDQQPRPGEGKIFRDVANMMIQMLVKFVLVTEAPRVGYLSPLRELLRKQPRLAIATLNYDNCVELFCTSSNIRCETGIDEWSNTGTFDMEGNGVFLLKLHGSIDWQSKPGRAPERPMPHRIISRLAPDAVGKGEHRPAVIFGHRNKLTAEGPFLDLLRAFERELVAAEVLTIVGYSFGDAHVNIYLSNWLNSRTGNRLRIVNPSFDRRHNEYIDQLLQFARERVEVVKLPAGEALTQLYAQLQLEGIDAPSAPPEHEPSTEEVPNTQ
ncbi:hypothetical protein BH20VER3_BH20VER3_06040 [soil metagenome]